MLYEPLHVKLEGTASYLLAVSHSLECPDNFFLQCQKQLAVSKCFLCPFTTPYAVFGLSRSILEYFAFQMRSTGYLKLSPHNNITICITKTLL